jgi:hypothetical protein
VEQTSTCILCGDPIEPDQASMTSESGEAAHSGCVYGLADPSDRDRWMPPEAAG